MGFKFGNYELRRNGFINLAQERADAEADSDIIKRIHKITLTRIAKQIKDWQIATQVADSVVNPLNWLLMAVYRDIEVDAHLYALMQTIVLKVLANNFVWVTQVETTDFKGDKIIKDVVDEVVTAKFRKKWFRKFTIHALNSKNYGYSLVQFGDFIDGCFSNCTLVPRDYVNQRLRVVQTTLASSKDGIPYELPPFNKWTLGIGDPEDFGLLQKAAPLVIKKKEVISAWSEAAELFGQPFRYGKTNISSPEKRKNMEDMLENMGSAAWGVFDKDDIIDFIQAKRTDFYQIYDKFIDRINSELSKLMLLQTGTTDEKAFVGAAQVHDDILTDVIGAMITFFEETVNEDLKPLCIAHGMVTEAHTFKTLNDQKLSMQDTIAALTVFLQFYELPAQWINEKFDIPVEMKTPAMPGKIDPVKNSPSEVMNQLKAIYGDFFSGKHSHSRLKKNGKK